MLHRIVMGEETTVGLKMNTTDVHLALHKATIEHTADRLLQANEPLHPTAERILHAPPQEVVGHPVVADHTLTDQVVTHVVRAMSPEAAVLLDHPTTPDGRTPAAVVRVRAEGIALNLAATTEVATPVVQVDHTAVRDQATTADPLDHDRVDPDRATALEEAGLPTQAEADLRQEAVDHRTLEVVVHPDHHLRVVDLQEEEEAVNTLNYKTT